jgi:hypothetical protein
MIVSYYPAEDICATCQSSRYSLFPISRRPVSLVLPLDDALARAITEPYAASIASKSPHRAHGMCCSRVLTRCRAAVATGDARAKSDARNVNVQRRQTALRTALRRRRRRCHGHRKCRSAFESLAIKRLQALGIVAESLEFLCKVFRRELCRIATPARDIVKVRRVTWKRRTYARTRGCSDHGRRCRREIACDRKLGCCRCDACSARPHVAKLPGWHRACCGEVRSRLRL